MNKVLEALKDIYDTLIDDIERQEDEFYNPSDDIKYWKEEYNIVKQALERLEQLEKENQELIRKVDCCMWLECNKISQENNKLKKAIDFLKLNFDISLDSKLRINDGSECIQTFIINLPENTTIDEMFEILKEVLKNE